MGTFTRTGLSPVLLPCCTRNNACLAANAGSTSPGKEQQGSRARTRCLFLPYHIQAKPYLSGLPSFHFPITLTTLSKKSTFCARGWLVMGNCSAPSLYRSIYPVLFVPQKSLKASEAGTEKHSAETAPGTLLLCRDDFHRMTEYPELERTHKDHQSSERF